MSVRRLEILQWVGVVVAPAAWTLQHVVGFGIAQARCSIGGEHWGISNTSWELALLACAALLVLLSETAAVAVFRATRGEDPEQSRLHFFATAAMVANVLFLAILLMDGLASALEKACVGS
jgi:hypothetical protein